MQVYQPWNSTNSYSPHGWTMSSNDRNGQLQYIALGTQDGVNTYTLNPYYEVTVNNPPPPTATPTRTPTPRPVPTRNCHLVYCTPTPPSSSSLRGHGAPLASSATPMPGTPTPVAVVVENQANAPVVASALADTTITKYYYFNGQRIGMQTRVNGVWLPYDLHNDHLGSTVLAATQDGMVATTQRYYAYGRTRYGNIAVTDHRFTGQKLDATGLQSFNTRYYDPELGQFLSPDTLVPDPANLLDYNRYAYARANPMRYTDPTGHQAECVAMGAFPPAAVGCQVGQMAMRYGPTILQLALQWADKLPAVDWLFSGAEQGTQSAGQQNAGNSGNTGSPNGWDPNDPWNSFRSSSMVQKGIDYLQKATQKGSVNLEKAYNQYNELLRLKANPPTTPGWLERSRLGGQWSITRGSAIPSVTAAQPETLPRSRHRARG